MIPRKNFPRPALLGIALGALSILAVFPAAAQEAEAPEDNPFWNRLSERFDTNGDGQVTKEEFESQSDRFERMDRNDDGVLTPADFEGIRRGPRGPRRGMMGAHLFRAADTDENGDLSREEWTGFLGSVDTDGDGKLSRDELQAARPADAPAPPRPPRPPAAPDAPDAPDAPEAPEFDGFEVEKLTALFDRFDKNDDGVITEDERPQRRGPRGPRRGAPRGGEDLGGGLGGTYFGDL